MKVAWVWSGKKVIWVKYNSGGFSSSTVNDIYKSWLEGVCKSMKNQWRVTGGIEPNMCRGPDVDSSWMSCVSVALRWPCFAWVVFSVHDNHAYYACSTWGKVQPWFKFVQTESTQITNVKYLLNWDQTLLIAELIENKQKSMLVCVISGEEEKAVNWE